MISGSCSCHEHTTNLATGASRLPVLDCGTTFHPGRDCPSTPSISSTWRLKHLVTRRYTNELIYLPIYLLTTWMLQLMNKRLYSIKRLQLQITVTINTSYQYVSSAIDFRSCNGVRPIVFCDITI